MGKIKEVSDSCYFLTSLIYILPLKQKHEPKAVAEEA